MVYKKYIKRNGKTYGPYIYQSRRVNGKVVSEYHGAGKPEYKRFLFLLFGFLFIIILIFLSFNFNGKITGKAISDSELSQTQNSLDETKITYPVVYFTLISKQIQTDDSEKETEEEQIETDSSATEQNITETEEQSEENQTHPNQNNTQNMEENVTEESQQSGGGETTIQNETTEEEPSTSEMIETSEQSSEQLSEEMNIEPEPDTESESLSETENTEETNAPITGGVIAGMFKKIFNFFLGLRFTGKTVSEPIVTEISGEVSTDNPFIYDIKEGEIVELLSGSVKTNSKNLDDNAIQMIYQTNQVLISTNYSEPEFNSVINQTNESNLTINISIENFNIESLTAEEKEFLIETFGNSSVQTIKSELFNGRYIIEYKLGDYEIEYSYDSNLNNETLMLNMESDRIKWLRNIIKELSKDKSVPQEANQFILYYPLKE